MSNTIESEDSVGEQNKITVPSEVEQRVFEQERRTRGTSIEREGAGLTSAISAVERQALHRCWRSQQECDCYEEQQPHSFLALPNQRR